MSWASIAQNTIPELKLLHHVPNGGFRTVVEGAIFKSMGVKPGIPDYFLPVARQGHHGLYLEMKSSHGGTLSDAQSFWINALCDQAYKTIICYDWEAAKDEICAYLGSG